ncbi:IclR family transcriptional regulator [Halorubrum sp. DTA46]|uniref:IclR family transcriptional regulator n=1 Tax=Halorubrum sp. DTA46 TaxID=3402162 RepID=UPI003AAE9FD6
MTGSGSESRQLATVGRACDVIRTLNQLEEAGVTEVAAHVGISKSSAHAYLNTLRKKHLVVQTDGKYRLSLEFLYLGNAVQRRNILFTYGKPVVEELAAETGEYVHLMCEQHGLERNILKCAGEHAVGEEYHATKEQEPDYLHFTASGKAVLAALPEQRVESIIEDHDLPEKTAKTITEPSDLFEELSTIRSRGYAINDEEEVVGIRAVGAPIRDANGGVLGAISVSGPTGRFTLDRCHETFSGTVTESANVIEAKLNMSSASKSMQ